jgi:glycosyltransferase involved in cell wall biosynthesis
MAESRDVTVVVPTQARADRAHLLRRAVGSVLAQEDVEARVLAVVNGPSPESEILDWLDEQPRCRVLRRKRPELASALEAGVRAASTTFVGTLDDDDLLLPRGLTARIDALTENPEWDAVVTNGLRRTAAGDTVHVVDMEAVVRDPLEALTRFNWLLPGAWTGRTERVASDLLAGMPSNAECTYTAVRLALDFEVGFLPEPTVVWDTTTQGSMSKGAAYVLGLPAASRRILELPLPSGVRRAFEVKRRRTAHHIAEIFMNDGQLGQAWRWHLTSLLGPGGYRHIWFTRRLIAALWKR